MNIAERHKFILDKLKEAGIVSVAELSKALDVTMVTIRKDLKLLEDRKLLFRSHGSATPTSPYVNDKPVDEKKLVMVSEKDKIARLAAELIEDDDAIIIGSGTSVTALARAIPNQKKVTVLTAALNVTIALMEHPNIEIVQLGGIVRKSSSSVVGHYAEEMLASFSCSKLFLGADGISPDFGLTTSNMMEAHLNTKMIKSVQKVIVLADSSKFGRKGFGKVCDVDDLDMVITDAGIPDIYRIKLEERGVEVLIAE
ncbi:transcriptional regulator [Rhodonellum psychrophilum GCM71 = DSM 17998]|uniref:Transcriptional regulator n=2 Tax=Rhodonellum TaxID=336827 RepID=U5BXD0_9BACT|nr:MULTISPECIES: DeoR/GlpR family DNA-binding transcription regulator [Rhodonellum]ERM82224.1 transcriptional regulator [Rhodonellum psychrophilum GCM71 = DSM 17998]SDZ40811.1 transcriptional regulator, DeoR family [Rhodonellum ikkaensis]